MKRFLKYNISIFKVWLTYIFLRKPFTQEAYDIVKDNYRSTPREKKIMVRIARINRLTT